MSSKGQASARQRCKDTPDATSAFNPLGTRNRIGSLSVPLQYYVVSSSTIWTLCVVRAVVLVMSCSSKKTVWNILEKSTHEKERSLMSQKVIQVGRGLYGRVFSENRTKRFYRLHCLTVSNSTLSTTVAEPAKSHNAVTQTPPPTQQQESALMLPLSS